MRKNYPVWLGFLAGCAAATYLVANADTTDPFLSRILRPFGFLGFILGNVHQGSAAVSISAIYVAFAGGGAVVGLLCRLAFTYVKRRRALK